MRECPESLKRALVDWVSNADHAPTPGETAKYVAAISDLDRREARDLIATMVAGGWIDYADRFGRTVLVPSSQQPIVISPRLVLLSEHAPRPPFMTPETALARLVRGRSFGDGHHPTTRLCLEALDRLFADPDFTSRARSAEALDIGAGTGVLSIAVLALGMAEATALDIDPWARHETLLNARLNGMGHRIRVSDVPLHTLERPFLLIIANLRWPTLKGMAGGIAEWLTPAGRLVISGIRPTEASRLGEEYGKWGMTMLEEYQREGWMAAILEKRTA